MKPRMNADKRERRTTAAWFGFLSAFGGVGPRLQEQ
jgi:hypothetical protein